MKLLFINQRAIILVAIVSVIVLLWCGANPRARAQGRLPKPTGHVNDFADVLDAVTKQRLEEVLENLKQRTGVDFVVATVSGTRGTDLYEYSLRVANDWGIGAPASSNKSVLLIIEADSGKFFTQVTGLARADLPDGLVGDMGQRMRPKIESSGYSQGLVTGIQTFANGLGERQQFTFADLEAGPAGNLVAKERRPRRVERPAVQQTETETPTPAPSPTPMVAESPKPTATLKPLPSPTLQPLETPQMAVPSPVPSPRATESPSRPFRLRPLPQATLSPLPQATLSPSPETTPSPSPQASEQPPPVEVKTATPVPSPAPLASPSVTNQSTEVAVNSAPSARSTATDRKTAPAGNPEDEKEQVELTLTLPADKRIDALKAFIAAHPQSVAVPRANELIVVAHAVLGDQKLQAGDTDGGLKQLRLAISEAPFDMSDRLFIEIIAHIPTNMFLRGQRAASIDAARQAEALAKLNPKRLLAVSEFYLAIEDANEAGRLAELALQNAPDLAAAHQALGAARHIGLRLEEAESEYARALALDPKSAAAKVALADLKRASGKYEEALPLYRELLQADPKSNSSRAGLVVCLLELGKKDEADQELSKALQDKDQSRNLPLLVGASYWLLAHKDPTRGLDLAQKAVELEPRYSWGQIALARALIMNRRPLEAERSLRFVRQFSRFPTLDYELANMLAAAGLYDEAAQELANSFSIKGGQIETRLAGRIPAHANGFVELISPERCAAIFQLRPIDTEANAKMLKALLALNVALNPPSDEKPNEDEIVAIAQDFTAGNDGMRTYRQVYVAAKLVTKRIALSTVIDLMDQATRGVEAALSEPAATVAVQPEELSDIRARALAQGGTPAVPEAPRAALSGLLRGRIEDLSGLALFNLDRPAEAVARLKLAVSAAPEGTPLWRSSLWHLGAALEANGKNDQALLYYIKSYVAGPPDGARRAVIENVYKKVNGTLDGLDDKIGPASAASSAAPTPTP